MAKWNSKTIYLVTKVEHHEHTVIIRAYSKKRWAEIEAERLNKLGEQHCGYFVVPTALLDEHGF